MDVEIAQNILASVEKFYFDGDSADVTFTFDSIGFGYNGTATKIAAHKILLAAGSDVFRAMFYGALKETGEIHVADASFIELKEFLQYFYKTKFKVSAANIFGVMYLGHKYNVQKCVDDCTAFLKRNLNDGMVCYTLSAGILYDRLDLVKSCEKHIISNAEGIFKTTGFLYCNRMVLKHILNMDFFRCSEVDVFAGCMQWVEHQSGIEALTREIVQQHLGDLYYKIRFASMTMHELCSLQTKFSSVISSDFITIAKIITLGPAFQPIGFSTAPRQIKWNKDAIVMCDREGYFIQNSHFRCVEYENEIFSSNEPLVLGGFWCSFPMSNAHDNNAGQGTAVDVLIIESRNNDSNTEVLSNIQARLFSDQTHISLPRPILIRPGFLYTIRIGPFTHAHYILGQTMKSKIQLDSGVMINFHNNYAGDNVICSLIRALEVNTL